MSAVVQLPRGRRAAFVQAERRIALLGTGVVGSAFVARCERLRLAGVPVPGFAWLANSRAVVEGGADPLRALAGLGDAPRRGGAWAAWVEATGLRRGDVLVDATASDVVAGWHSEWLARGVHVVTANKLGAGAALARAQAIREAAEASGARYGDAATVGAGLPLLRSIRALVAGGDRVLAIEGLLSGSLAWLFDGDPGNRPFSARVREARALGYTEPDPRIDLSGEDVRRKLLILARAAGIALEEEAVQVESLVPAALAGAAADAVEPLLGTLDAPMAARFAAARSAGTRLRFVGRLEGGRATVGLRALSAAHPLCAGGGTDNIVAITSCRYDRQPLLIRGPGAGAGVTAAALLDDVLSIPRGPLSTR
ncbi:homoserine dehydrogenase [Luteimonas sp. Sa2BVA3]|uniref:Homoserine dehydrogenase n=1 Tax=Luteimonas colneyensis TaxID=2762230 RepID=A0ABR8UKS1_9GAMM|nr:homoserine dehydrogenase [Luteimonas colneyensis]MBD7988611.1 homoserine dehydrogenase [Luteimonas colneyensis]